MFMNIIASNQNPSPARKLIAEMHSIRGRYNVTLDMSLSSAARGIPSTISPAHFSPRA
jgi:hypothetical protein